MKVNYFKLRYFFLLLACCKNTNRIDLFVCDWKEKAGNQAIALSISGAIMPYQSVERASQSCLQNYA